MRFQPNRRASIDQRPGPNMARAAEAVPSNSKTNQSPGSVSTSPISTMAMEIPAIGVHKPTISSIPPAIKSTVGIVPPTLGGSHHSLQLARTTSAVPTTKRRRSKPVPGQPPANVEYKRRNFAPFLTRPESRVWEKQRNPKKRRNRHSFGVNMPRGKGET